MYAHVINYSMVVVIKTREILGLIYFASTKYYKDVNEKK